MKTESHFELSVNVERITPREGQYPTNETLAKFELEVDPARAFSIFQRALREATGGPSMWIQEDRDDHQRFLSQEELA